MPVPHRPKRQVQRALLMTTNQFSQGLGMPLADLTYELFVCI
jgi:hypothetical protein